MNEYLIIIGIIADVLNGKNLTNVFNQHVNQTKVNVAKIKDITYGVLRNYNVINLIVNHLVNKKPENKIKIILLVGIYELKYTKKPHFAVTNEIVNLTYKLFHNLQLKNFVNAILRNYLRNCESIEAELNKQDEFRLNFPQWLINQLKSSYPNEYETIIKNLNMKPHLGIRINKKRITLENYVSKLNDNLIKYQLVDNKIVITDSLTVDSIPGFKDGEVSIQDVSAQKLIDLITINSGENILDACSAPGGKLCQILENYPVSILGIDIDEFRLLKVQQNLTRLNLKANLITADAIKLDWWDGNLFDTIIADVPCSASGTIKRNPDIKLHRQAADIDLFVNTQRQIVANLWSLVKPGGQLVYITCSIFIQENSSNIEYFKNKFKDMHIERKLLLLPLPNADGFFYCVLKKQGIL